MIATVELNDIIERNRWASTHKIYIIYYFKSLFITSLQKNWFKKTLNIEIKWLTSIINLNWYKIRKIKDTFSALMLQRFNRHVPELKAFSLMLPSSLGFPEIKWNYSNEFSRINRFCVCLLLIVICSQLYIMNTYRTLYYPYTLPPHCNHSLHHNLCKDSF